MSLHNAPPPAEIPRKPPLTAGFTLIELSVVLVIIGLIVGGVLMGRDMIAQAELRKLYSDVQRYETAVNAFRDKYMCLPGDCANATNFFGVASQGCQRSGNAGWINGAGGTGTCNGDGDGIVYNQPSRGNGIAADEPGLVWNHLALAGMVPGNYNGVYVSNGGTYFGLQAGSNVPYTIRNGGIDMMMYWVGDTSNSILTNAFVVGGSITQGGGGDYSQSGGLLTPLEAQSLDTKFDDGNPITGIITGGPWNGWGQPTDCMASPHLGATYDTALTGQICILYFQYGLN